MKKEHSINTTLGSQQSNQPLGQKITYDRKIYIPKIGWLVRICTILFISGIIGYSLILGFEIRDPIILFSVIMPTEALIAVITSWFFYRNPTQEAIGDELVSVLVPVFNQSSMIPLVIDAIENSTYGNIEIIAVNDGSTDGTRKTLDKMKTKYPNLTVIHKKNGGKRSANAIAFSKARGNLLVFIDSDSIIDQYAIEEFVKTFNANPDVGAVVGHAKVWNSKKNLLTKLQDSWYDYSFNVVKTSESTLETVTCCSGCLSAYRKTAIKKFVPLWNKEVNQGTVSDDNYFRSNPWASKKMTKASIRILKWAAQFDDAEDSVLTAQTLVDWKALYVSTAKVYTDVPENLKGFLKQQIRWKKGWLRTSFFLMTYFWRKNPLISTVFYINLISTFTIPLILFSTLFYAPFILHKYWIPLLYFSGIISLGFAQGLDYKFRDPTSKNWKYKPIMNILTGYVFPWLLIPALWTIRKSQWLTR